MSRVVFVVAETREGQPTALTREVVGLAKTVAQTVCAIACAPAAGDALAEAGADYVYTIGAAPEDYEAEIWVANVARVARDLKADAVFVAHSPTGADLAPRLAMRLGAGVAMGCVDVREQDGRFMFTRPCHGGNVRETLSFPGMAVATIRPGVGVPQTVADSECEVVEIAPAEVAPRFRVVARERDTGSGRRLEDAKIVVAGGRGLEGPEGFRVLEGLADVLDGVVGASRVPCDLGWCPHSWQIGLTGRTVTPDLYFAVGISGAGHHLAGCGTSKTIVAINTDPDAAIFKEAKFGIVGDYRKVVPALTQALAELKS